MKKNLFSLLFIAILGFTLIACEENGLDSILGNQETQVLMDHMHNYDKAWASDEESHWHNPLCEDTEEVVAKGLHSWNGGTITTPATENAEGVMTYACVVCGYEKVEELPAIEHVCDFGTELKYNEESHWYECRCGLTKDVTNHVITSIDLDGIRTHSCECGYKEEVSLLTLTVINEYITGEVHSEEKFTFEEGEAYSLTPTAINFMAPDIEKIDGTLTENTTIKVTYDYSNEGVQTVNYGDHFDKFMIDEEKGLSISYIASGSTNDWEEMLVGDTFVIFAGCLRARDCKTPKIYSFDWYDGQNPQNGAVWNALLSSEGNELFVTWTIDSTGIKCYKNGILVFMWDASFKTGGQWYGSGYNASIHPENIISTLVNNIFTEVATKGLEIGTKNDANGTPLHQTTIRNLKIGYSKTAEAIAAEAKKLQQITINLVDEENKPLHPAFVILEEIGLEYEMPTYEIPGYETETKVLSGTLSNTPEEYTLVYKQIGEEQLTELGSFINEGTGWSLARTWFNVADDLVGDYVVVVKYHMNGNLAGKTSSGDYCWRTLLPIIHKANNTNIRWILRYDWHSWQEQCGSVYGTSYIESQYVNDTGAEFKALIEDCDITTIFSRSGSTIKVYSIMTATSGSWVGKVYFYEAKLFGVSYEDIGIAFSGESAKGQFTSIKIA